MFLSNGAIRMESINITEDDKTYEPERDIWLDEYNHLFVKNQYDPSIAPVFVDISGQHWIFRSLGEGYINWTNLGLPSSIETAFKIAIQKKLKHVNYKYLNECRFMLSELKVELKPNFVSLSDLKMPDIHMIWNNMTAGYRSYFRSLYSYLASQNIGGASQVIAAKLKEMKARDEVRALKNVLNWHSTKGALTQEEEIIFRSSIEIDIKNHPKEIRNENIKELEVRLYCWLLIATLKRGIQIRGLRADCLKITDKNGVKDYFVLIKPAKRQNGDPERWWPIQDTLYHEMQRYSSDPKVHKLQLVYDRFWVLDCLTLHQNGIVDPWDANIAIHDYIKISLNLVSPRTGKPLHITANRIRHTGATRLAYKGVSRDIISEILEHDDPGSCQAYIDAVGSELCPSLNRADRNMGSLFLQLNQIYFKGKLVDELTDQPIIIPDFSEPTSIPLFVGSCARNTCKEGSCHKHPFIGCYNGCSNFLAWREADHYRALKFADKELERWRKASGHTAQVSTVKELEELKSNILVVIERIKQIKGIS